MKERLFQLRIIVILLIIVAAIAIPLILSDREEQLQKSFQENSTIIKVKKRDLVTTTTKKYKDIKTQFESDYYFRKVATMPSMETATLPTSYTQTLLEQFMYNFDISDKDEFVAYDDSTGSYCLNKSDLEDGYRELYNFGKNVDAYLEYLPGYYEYVSVLNNRYCFQFGQKIISDDEVLVGIEKLGYSDNDSILANMYVYTFHSTGTKTERKYKTDVEGYIAADRFTDASKVVTNKLNGTVTHKQLKFKINKNPKYFKYSVIKSAIIK